MAAFKKQVRKVNTYAVPEEQVWHLETSYAMRNRLAAAGITNRQAAVWGCPHINKEDAEKIMATILALRGYDKKKHVEAWKQGELRTIPKDFKWQGTSQKWRTAVKQEV